MEGGIQISYSRRGALSRSMKRKIYRRKQQRCVIARPDPEASFFFSLTLIFRLFYFMPSQFR
jgi:hypothetical protein